MVLEMFNLADMCHI